jgi:hypothetical protein
MPAQEADGWNRPLIKLRGALEVLDGEQLLNAFGRRQAIAEFDGADARLQAWGEPIWPRAELAGRYLVFWYGRH